MENESVKGYFWGAVTTTVLLVLTYLIAPLSGSVDENKSSIVLHETRLSVLESEVQNAFRRIEKKLDQIDKRLNGK
tara:strand:- start:13439 stop:13666 length:228 start_codon:yes stop_codon:yes gene_type:complete